MRLLPPAEAKALRKRNATTVYIGGLFIAAFVSIPIVNLATPMFAMAFMVHLHKRLGSRNQLTGSRDQKPGIRHRKQDPRMNSR
jgi:CysZ protein